MTELARVLKARDVVALAFGAMVGWSWVVLSGTWISTGGVWGATLAFLVGGVALLLIGLTYAELVSAMPEVGGEHVYSLRALGVVSSFVCTWALIFAYVSVVAFEAVALPTAMGYLVPGLDRGYLWTVLGWDVHAAWVAVGVLGAVAMVTLNIVGIRPVGSLQTVATTLVVVGGGVFLVFAAFSTSSVPTAAQSTQAFSGPGMLGVLVMVPFMFVGFDVIPQAAEELDVPPRRIGGLLMLSVALAVAWYVLIILGVGRTLPASQLEVSDSIATADAATAVFSSTFGGQFIVVTGVLGILTSWNALLVGASRAVFAMARGGMLPRFLGELDPRFRTPRNALLLVGALSIVAPFFGRPALVWFVNAGGLGVVVAYGFVAASFLVLRRREASLERPFRVRGGALVGWLALFLSVGLGALYFPWSPSALRWPQEWLLVFLWAALGLVFYRMARRGGRLSEPSAHAEQD